MTASARIAAAIALFDPRPGERILEIGCGTGHAIAAMLSSRPGATIFAVDRSEIAVAQASKRNAAAIEAGHVRIFLGDIDAAPVTGRPFDRILAIRVNTFWTRPGLALPNIAASLRPGGALWMIYDAPQDKIVDPIETSLVRYGAPRPDRRSCAGAFALVARLDPATG